MKMGILIRQENEKWVIEVREAWAFSLEDMQKFFEFLQGFKGVCFNVSLLGEDGNTFKVNFTEAKFYFTNDKAMRIILDSLIDYKVKHGQLSEHHRCVRGYGEERY